MESRDIVSLLIRIASIIASTVPYKQEIPQTNKSILLLLLFTKILLYKMDYD